VQQKILRVEVRKEAGKGKDWWKIRDLLAEERCGWAVLDSLASTEVGRRVPTEGGEVVSAVSEAEVQEWLVEQGAGAEETGAGGTPLYLPTPDFMASAGTVYFFFFFFYLFITRVRPMEIMARLCTVRFLSAVRAVAARWKHPFALRPGLSPESVK